MWPAKMAIHSDFFDGGYPGLSSTSGNQLKIAFSTSEAEEFLEQNPDVTIIYKSEVLMYVKFATLDSMTLFKLNFSESFS